MLWTVVMILVILWALGFFVANVGSLVHILLVLVIVAIAYEFLVNRRRTPL